MAPYVHRWSAAEPRCIVLIAHGYGEHAGRYEHVAQRLVDDSARRCTRPTTAATGGPTGDRRWSRTARRSRTTCTTCADAARAEHPGLPVVLIGHSMGGLIATRYAQRFGDELTALVLSGPAIGGNPALRALLEMDPIPEIPIDPAVLSRDPAVGEAYAADPLVYHGPFQRDDARALFAAHRAASRRAAASATCRRSGSTARRTSSSRSSSPARRSSTSAAPTFEEHVYDGARHEIFNETNRDEVLDDVIAFLRGALG